MACCVPSEAIFRGQKETHTAQYSPCWVGKLYTFLESMGTPNLGAGAVALLVVTSHLSFVKKLHLAWSTLDVHRCGRQSSNLLV